MVTSPLPRVTSYTEARIDIGRTVRINKRSVRLRRKMVLRRTDAAVGQKKTIGIRAVISRAAALTIPRRYDCQHPYPGRPAVNYCGRRDLRYLVRLRDRPPFAVNRVKGRKPPLAKCDPRL